MAGETIGETRLNKHVPISGTDTERANLAIQLPAELEAPDGRRFYLRSWKPSVSIESVVTVELEAIVMMEPKIAQPAIAEPKQGRIKNSEGGEV